METFATGADRLLKLLHIDLGDGIPVWCWWDTDDEHYLVYKRLWWHGDNGRCQALEWAITNGYRLDGNRV